MVREAGRGDSGDSVLEKLNVERVPRRGSAAVLREEAAAGRLEVRPRPPHPGSVPDILGKLCPSVGLTCK